MIELKVLPSLFQGILSSIPAAAATPYGSILTVALGLPECSLKIYKKQVLGVIGNGTQDFLTAMDCLTDILDPLLGSHIGAVSPSNATRNIVGSIVSKRLFRNVRLKRASLKLIEVFTGWVLEKANDNLLLGFSPRMDRLDAKIRMISQFKLASESTVITLENIDAIIVTQGTVQYTSLEEAYSLNSGRKIINVCSLDQKTFLKEVESTIGKELLSSIAGPQSLKLKEGDQIYIFEGNPCLYIK